MSLPALIAVSVVLFFTVVILLIVSSSRKQTKVQEQFFTQLSALGGDGKGTDRVITIGGRQVRTKYTAAGQNTPSRFSLITSVSALGAWILEKEGAVDGFFEGLGLEGKISTQDPDFDARFHIVADEDQFAAAYFADAKKRQAAAALFGLGWSGLSLTADGLKADRSPFEFKEGTDAGFVRDSLPHLAVLAEDLPQGLPFRLGTGISQKAFNGLFIAGLVGLYVGIIAVPLLGANYRPVRGFQVFLASLSWSLPVLAAYMTAIVAVLKGKSWFIKGFFQALVVGLIWCPLGGYYGFLWVNCRNDSAEPTRREVPVVGKYTTSGKHSTYYHARVRSWRTDADSESLSVSYPTYNRLVSGRTVARVETKPGRLGHEWIVRYSFVEPTQ